MPVSRVSVGQRCADRRQHCRRPLFASLLVRSADQRLGWSSAEPAADSGELLIGWETTS
jgi:hypothetical protein